MIPAKALEQHIAILGKTGSGKTYAAKGVAERILSEGGRVCVIDPTGAWHGLRSSATGKSAGFPVVIFGGSHADLPLGAAHGEAMAEIIGTASTPAIIDTSAMRVKERTRFFADFADALVRKNKGPLHLIIDEAHLFAPQGKVNDPQSGEMLHAANNLVSLGRSRGLRIILITQRPAKLHKDSLTQVETLVAMRLIAPQDRKAVEEWIKDNADEAKGREIIQSLATLKTGRGWIWAPEIGVLEQVAFPKIKTFDSSRAPDGSTGTGPVMAPIDKDAVAARLETVAKDALANDPARLRAENAALRAENAALRRQIDTAPKAAADPDAIAAAEARGYERARVDTAAIRARVVSFATVLAKSLEDARREMEAITQIFSAAPPPPPRPAPAARPTTQRQPAREIVHGEAPSPLPKGERACLIAIAQHPNGVRREQLTVITGYKRSSRDAYIQRLREKGMVEDGSQITATEAGISALGSDYQPLPTGSALQQHVMERLPEGERKVLEYLVTEYPNIVDRDAIDTATGYKRSSRDAYLQRLSARDLVAVERDGVRASANLFD